MQPYAEYWIGDHINGPATVTIDRLNPLHVDLFGMTFCEEKNGLGVSITELIKTDPVKFLGLEYKDCYPLAGDNIACLFKVLSVRSALSI